MPEGKTFKDVLERFRSITFNEDFDLIVAVANGGIIPAAILNQRLNVDIRLIKISLRDNNQKPKYGAPQLVAPIDFDFKEKKILLVEDRVKTGASLRFACDLLNKEAAWVKTFAVNGAADYSLYEEECFKFPWILDIKI